MGAAASAIEVIRKVSDEELNRAIQGLSPEDRAKLKRSLENASGNFSGNMTADTMPAGLQYVYGKGFAGKPDYEPEKAAKECYHADYNSHANIMEPGKAGPGPNGIANLIKGFVAPVPDIKWTVEEVYYCKMPIGEKYVLVSTCCGTPKEAFLNIPPTGKGFNFMAIDIHHVIDGKVKESWHIEELAPAIGQMTSKDGPDGVPPLHKGQASHFGNVKQVAAGKQITKEEMPECMKTLYHKGFNGGDPSLDLAGAKSALHDDWISHPSPDGKDGPGAEGWLKSLPFLHAMKSKFETVGVLQVPCENGMEKYVHVSSYTGSTDGKFLGLDLPAAKDFNVMAIDIHLVGEGKIKESWHIEDWA
eukprot:CAMPEP_0197632822 /NCGR_PEP_ID=MMETSP1338-20131121/9384_1 /TAXON_ID=43686 ORGANISM="Pelagodinium beii, Strain RCC1491" /NCGR_SAMPLE_ID=MMETSP1338 /ASSEMBLY_ACC=CAM_ASM_000754 /LENGTH=359 /DNA_ID=CAMNT_0043204393 /DNA_START=61 /DNA_END=1136 /DNA_ORIENTATION=+